MISVFIYRDTEDFGHWRWKAGPQNRIMLSEEEPTYPQSSGQGAGPSDKKHTCHVRSEPTPAMVLPPDADEDVKAFIGSIIPDSYDKASRSLAMRKFIGVVREKIGLCPEVSGLRDEPLAVFIHFGGEGYGNYNIRLHEAWEGLQDDSVKQRFLCFAITRGGTNGNIINEAWLRHEDGTIVLDLPDSLEQVKAVLSKGCKEVWNIPLPQPFSSVEAVPMAPPTAKEGKASQRDEAHIVSKTSTPTHSNDESDGSNDGDAKEAGNCIKIHVDTRLACALKWMIAVGMFSGFVLAWVKCFLVHSVVATLGFGGLGLLFLVIAVGLLLKTHEEADLASVQEAMLALKAHADKLEAQVKETEAEKFATENEAKADKVALKNAFLVSPKAARVLVAGIAGPKAPPAQTKP